MTLIHGDCLEEMDKLIEQGVKVDMILCDLPYGVTACRWDSVIPFDKMWNRLKLIRKNRHTSMLLFGSEPFSSALRMSNIKEYKYDWYWRKTKANGFFNVKKMPLKDIETISVFYDKLPTYNPQGIEVYGKEVKNPKGKLDNTNHISGHNGGALKNESYVREFTNYPRQILDFSIVARPIHPTQKPIELMEYLIKTYTNEKDLVLDFTMGSGSTGVACKNLNRKFIGIELDDTYFEIAKERIKHT